MDSNSPIGVFDSGLGGLTVLKELRRLLPHENFIFIGDSARAPYGSRTPEEIISFPENSRADRPTGLRQRRPCAAGSFQVPRGGRCRTSC